MIQFVIKYQRSMNGFWLYQSTGFWQYTSKIDVEAPRVPLQEYRSMWQETSNFCIAETQDMRAASLK